MKPWKKQAAGAMRLICKAGGDGVIAPPVPARDYIPSWFHRLPAVDEQKVS